MKTDQEALDEALRLVEDPAHWVQGSYARTAEGHQLDLIDVYRGERWCAVGALKKASADLLQFQRLTSAVGASVGGNPEQSASARIVRFNDHHQHEDVILALKRGLDHLA